MMIGNLSDVRERKYSFTGIRNDHRTLQRRKSSSTFSFSGAVSPRFRICLTSSRSDDCRQTPRQSTNPIQSKSTIPPPVLFLFCLPEMGSSLSVLLKLIVQQQHQTQQQQHVVPAAAAANVSEQQQHHRHHPIQSSPPLPSRLRFCVCLLAMGTSVLAVCFDRSLYRTSGGGRIKNPTSQRVRPGWKQGK